jgi:hypothetical protein
MKLSKEQKILILLGIIIGILYFSFSVAIALRFIGFIFEKETSAKVILILLGFPILVLLSFIVSMAGILYRKRWAFRLYLVSTIFVWISSIKPLFLFSYYSILGISEILLLFLSALTFWLASKKTTREQFGLAYISARQEKFRKLNRIFGYSFAILVIMAIGYYAASYFVIYPRQRIFYSPKDNARLSQGYVKRNIFNLSLFIPKDARIVSLQKMSLFWNKGYILFMADSKDTMKISVNLDPTGELYKYLGFRNSYEFHRRLNRFLHFVSANFLRSKRHKIISSDVSIGESLEGFLMVFPSDDKKIICEYRLYDKNNKGITGSIHFLASKDSLGGINDIISSLELRSDSPKEAEDFFQEGLALIDENQYEEAKFSLVNAICQNWQNPKYNYYLGVAFFKTNNFNEAQRFLENSRGYAEAQALLGQIKNNSAIETRK